MLNYTGFTVTQERILRLQRTSQGGGQDTQAMVS